MTTTRKPTTRKRPIDVRSSLYGYAGRPGTRTAPVQGVRCG